MREVIQDMLKLYPSTIEYINQCFNVVVRAVATAITIAVLLALYIPLHYLINYVLDIATASDAVKERFSTLALIFIAVVAAASTFTSIRDVANLTVASWKISDDHSHTDSKNED